MNDDPHIPILMTLIFGEGARIAHANASTRLLRWCRAFDDWLAFRKKRCRKDAYQSYLYTWDEFLSLVLKTPWEVQAGDIQVYIDSLASRGLANATILRRLYELSNFYGWCQKRGIDPDCPPGFNPAKSLTWPKVVIYSRAHFLSAQEAAALLDAIRKEGSILSQRDYAFTLTRLMMGTPMPYLLGMQWGQIHFKKDGPWLKVKRSGRKWFKIPQPAWDAIRACLESSGRWEHMQPDHYIFAPLANPLLRGATGNLDDWDVTRHVQGNTMRRNLLRFARKAGISKDRFTILTLRNTAAMLRQEAGDDLKQLTEFLGLSDPQIAYKYLYYLQRTDKEREDDAPQECVAGEVPGEINRQPDQRRKPGVSRKHGLYTTPSPEAVEVVLKEGATGLDEEIQGLEWLNAALFALIEDTSSWAQKMKYTDVYTRSLGRWVKIRSANAQREDQRQSDFAQRLAWLKQDDSGDENSPPPGPDAWKQALISETSTEGSQRDAYANLLRAAASLRVLLRGALEIAPTMRDPGDFAALVERYGKTALRLARLWEQKNQIGMDLGARLQQLVARAVDEVWEEWMEEGGSVDP